MWLRKALGTMPERWRWTVHNMLGHPLSEAAHILGMNRLSDAIHDGTVPMPIGENPRG